MLTPVDEEQAKAVTGKVIREAYRVWDTLGGGFLERVYHNALEHYLNLTGFQVESGKKVDVYLPDGYRVGHFELDLLVDGWLVVELKAAVKDHPVFAAQTLNYLKATGLPLALLINFAEPGPQTKRIANDFLRVRFEKTDADLRRQGPQTSRS